LRYVLTRNVPFSGIEQFVVPESVLQSSAALPPVSMPIEKFSPACRSSALALSPLPPAKSTTSSAATTANTPKGANLINTEYLVFILFLLPSNP